MTNILVVDGEAGLELLITNRFGRKTKQQLYSFQFVTNSHEAVSTLQPEPTIYIITKGHGGTLKVESVPGEGAEFIVTLLIS